MATICPQSVPGNGAQRVWPMRAERARKETMSSILLLNAGSSSLKASLADSSDGRRIASGQADWAGATSRYRFTGPDGKQRTEAVLWKGHARAVQRFMSDLPENAGSVASQQRLRLVAVGHRVVHGG